MLNDGTSPTDMRKELSKETRKSFRAMMTAEFPDYKADKEQIVPLGWYVWSRRHPSGLFFHVLLVIDPTNDNFTTEAAWDFDGKMPSTLHVGGDQQEILASGPLHFRTWWLSNNGQMDNWWELVLKPGDEQSFLNPDPIDKCLPLVAPAVREAGDKLRDHLLPLFGRLALKYGEKA
jgi:hypothetical protein